MSKDKHPPTAVCMTLSLTRYFFPCLFWVIVHHIRYLLCASYLSLRPLTTCFSPRHWATSCAWTGTNSSEQPDITLPCALSAYPSCLFCRHWSETPKTCSGSTHTQLRRKEGINTPLGKTLTMDDWASLDGLFYEATFYMAS